MPCPRRKLRTLAQYGVLALTLLLVGYSLSQVKKHQQIEAPPRISALRRENELLNEREKVKAEEDGDEVNEKVDGDDVDSDKVEKVEKMIDVDTKVAQKSSCSIMLSIS